MKYNLEVDLIKLHLEGSPEQWNAWLTKCEREGNINELARMRYGIQAGMDKLARQKLNTEQLSVFFVRLNRSIEQTAKNILKRKHPMPGDQAGHKMAQVQKWKDAKSIRDREFQDFLKRSAF